MEFAHTISRAKNNTLHKQHGDFNQKLPQLPTEVRSGFIQLIALIVSTYLQLSLFQNLQERINSREKQSLTEIRATVKLMLRLIICEPTIDIAWRSHALGRFQEEHMDEFYDLRNRIRTALWIYCSIKISDLQPFEDFWNTCQAEYTHMRGGKVSDMFQSNLDSFDRQWLFQPRYGNDLISYEQKCRRNMRRQLRSLKHSIIQNPSKILGTFFKSMVTAKLNDLQFLIKLNYLSLDGQYKEFFMSRLFLAFANLHWTFNKAAAIKALVHCSQSVDQQTIESDRPRFDFLEYLVEQVTIRTGLMNLYDNFKQRHGSANFLRQFRGLLNRDTTELFQEAESMAITPKAIQYFQIGQRWRELVDSFGDAIILCGSPIEDRCMPFDIPLAVETATDDEFATLKAKLRAKFGWLTERCSQLYTVFMAFKEFSEKAQSSKTHRVVFDTRLHRSISEVLSTYDPMRVATMALRAKGLGTDARALLSGLERDKLLSLEPRVNLFVHCLATIQEQISSQPAESTEALRTCHNNCIKVIQLHAPLPTIPLAIYFMKVIFDSF